MKKSSFSVSRLAGAGTPAKVVCWFFFKDVDFCFLIRFFFFRIYARGCFSPRFFFCPFFGVSCGVAVSCVVLCKKSCERTAGCPDIKSFPFPTQTTKKKHQESCFFFVYVVGLYLFFVWCPCIRFRQQAAVFCVVAA